MTKLISFGKYKNQKVENLINDKPYYEWVIKQSFLKKSYESDYNIIKNYKKPFLFFETLYDNLDYDCILMLNEYLHLKITPTTRCMIGYEKNNDIMKDSSRYKTAFRHRKNIYNALKIQYKPFIKFNKINYKEFKLYHYYDIQAKVLEYICYDNKNDPYYEESCSADFGGNSSIKIRSDGESIYAWEHIQWAKVMKEVRHELRNEIIPFGKYKNLEVKWSSWVHAQHYHPHMRDGEEWIHEFNIVRWRLIKYMQWVKEKNILEKYPLFKWYLDENERMRHIYHMSKNLYN